MIPNLSDKDLEDAYRQGRFLRDLIRHAPHVPGSGRTRFFLELCGFNQEKADKLSNLEEKVFQQMKEECWHRGKNRF